MPSTTTTTVAAAADILQPLHRSTCVSQHLQLRTAGFYCSSYTLTYAICIL